MNKLQILFENDEIRVINKPQRLAVQGGKDVKTSVDTELALQTGEKIYVQIPINLGYILKAELLLEFKNIIKWS